MMRKGERKGAVALMCLMLLLGGLSLIGKCARSGSRGGSDYGRAPFETAEPVVTGDTVTEKSSGAKEKRGKNKGSSGNRNRGNGRGNGKRKGAANNRGSRPPLRDILADTIPSSRTPA